MDSLCIYTYVFDRKGLFVHATHNVHLHNTQNSCETHINFTSTYIRKITCIQYTVGLVFFFVSVYIKSMAIFRQNLIYMYDMHNDFS